VVIGTIAFGVPSALVISVSADDDGMETPHYFPVTLDRARVLAGIVAYLPNEVLAAFESHLSHMKKVAYAKPKSKLSEEKEED
jgi:hypothetical protein